MSLRPVNSHNKLGYLNTICSDSLSTHAKISILSLEDRKIPIIIEMSFLIIEYFQLVSQTLLLHDTLIEDVLNNETIETAVAYVAELITPSFFFTYETTNTLIGAILIISIICTLLRYAIFGYIILMSKEMVKLNLFIICLWKWIFRAQSRMLYYLTTSFWVSAIIGAIQGTYYLFGMGKIGTIIFFAILLCIEITFCLFLNFQLYSILPTKSVLSSKNSTLEIMTVSQKFVIQAFQILVVAISSSNNWLCSSINLIFCIVRNAYFFINLPLYNVNSLLLQGLLLMIVSSLDVSCFTLVIRDAIEGSKDDLDYLLMIWLILFILAAVVSHGYLKKAIFELATMPCRMSSSLLIHKITTIKQLSKEENKPSKYNDTCESSYLVSTTLNSSLTRALSINLGSGKSNIQYPPNSKEYYNQLFLCYLEEMQKKLSKYSRLKLFIAEIYAKKLKLYGIAMRFLTQLRNSPDSTTALNASLLLWNIQGLLRTESINNKSEIDLYTYFKSQISFTDLKKSMLKQADLQLDLYKEIMVNVPDLGKIFKSSQHLTEYRHQIQRNTNILIAKTPDFYIEPLLVSAYYSFTLNYSLIDYLKYTKMYAKKHQKYHKSFRSDNMIQENVYQNDTAFLIVSGQKEDLGKIYYCTNALGHIYGGDASSYIGADISVLAPINSQSFYSMFSKSTSKTIDHALLGHVFRGYSYHKEGYLIEIDLYIDVFPFLTQGFYFCVMIRSVTITKEYLVINLNGEVEGATKALVEKLNLDKTMLDNPFPVKLISEDLAQVNQAFNYMQQPEEETSFEKAVSLYQSRRTRAKLTKLGSSLPASPIRARKISITGDKARELYSTFNTQGGEVRLCSMPKNQENNEDKKDEVKNFNYDCKVTLLSQETCVLKLISLEENRRLDLSNANVEAENHSHRKLATLESPRSPHFLRLFETRKNDSVSNFDLVDGEDEKEAGWIDFGALRSKRFPTIISPTTMNDEMFTTNRFLMTTEGNLLSPISPIKGRNGERVFTYTLNTEGPKQRSSNYISNSIESLPDEEDKNAGITKLHETQTSKTGQLMRMPNQEQVSQAFTMAFNTKYYSRAFNIFWGIFFFVLGLVLMGQVYSKLSMDKTITNLKAKKELLFSSQIRDSSLVSLQRTFRYVWDVGSGSIVPSTFSTFQYVPNDTLGLVNVTLVALTNANQDVLINASSIDDSLSQVLFRQDVKIYNQKNQTELILNNFQATDQIIETGLKGLKIAYADVNASKDQLFFIFRNALNDLLLKTESTSALFLESIETETKDSRSQTILALVVEVGVLVIMMLILLRIILRGYSKEKTNMAALVKLDHSGIKEAQNRLNTFKQVLESKSHIQEKTVVESFQKYSKLYFDKKYETNKNSHIPNHKGIVNKYIFFSAKAIFFNSVIIGFMAWNSVGASNSINDLHQEQTKLYFANGIAKTVNLAYLACQELYDSDDTATIRNQNISTQLTQLVEDLQTIRNQALAVFRNADLSYDAQIKPLLFGHPCSLLTGARTSTTYCNYLENKGKTIGLISLLSDYQDVTNDKLEQYFELRNKTTAALRAIQVQNYDLMLSFIRVIIDETTLIAARINVIFEDKFDNVKKEREIALALLAVGVVIGVCFAWLLVFRQMREIRNQFKNILHNFSPSLILSNFLLKSFLLKNSNGVLDSIKADL